jgi:hypothetical protein
VLSEVAFITQKLKVRYGIFPALCERANVINVWTRRLIQETTTQSATVELCPFEFNPLIFSQAQPSLGPMT